MCEACVEIFRYSSYDKVSSIIMKYSSVKLIIRKIMIRDTNTWNVQNKLYIIGIGTRKSSTKVSLSLRKMHSYFHWKIFLLKERNCL